MSENRLAVLIDNRPLPEDEARALWVRFSEWMDEHRGDFEGFAKKEGYVFAKTEMREGKATLVISSTAQSAKDKAAPGGKTKTRARRRK